MPAVSWCCSPGHPLIQGLVLLSEHTAFVSHSLTNPVRFTFKFSRIVNFWDILTNLNGEWIWDSVHSCGFYCKVTGTGRFLILSIFIFLEHSQTLTKAQNKALSNNHDCGKTTNLLCCSRVSLHISFFQALFDFSLQPLEK